MHEVPAIVETFDAAMARGARCALATVVSVEGSAYRRAGARMLVCDDGSSTGTISAGCLEYDIVEQARRVLQSDAPKLLEFDTSAGSEDVAWGLGLGCRGVVRVLVEPLAPRSLCVEALRLSYAMPSDAVGICMATVFRGDGRIVPGARLVFDENGRVGHERLSDDTATLLAEEVRPSMDDGGSSGSRICHVEGVAVGVLVETLLPPVPLVIFGAGQDVLPVVALAKALGWRTEVVDPQARPASLARFVAADKITLSRPDEVATRVDVTPRTLALLMSHNYAHDLAALRFLLTSRARYIGIMGPWNRTERMLGDLAALGGFHVHGADLGRLRAPVGLDIGANGPIEIALSVVAEMRAVLDGRRGGMLRERRGPHATMRRQVPLPIAFSRGTDDAASQRHAASGL